MLFPSQYFIPLYGWILFYECITSCLSSCQLKDIWGYCEESRNGHGCENMCLILFSMLLCVCLLRNVLNGLS